MFVIIKIKEQFNSYVAEVLFKNTVIYTSPAFSLPELAILEGQHWLENLKCAQTRIMEITNNDK